MLTEGNLKYLETISDTELASINKFNPQTQMIAKVILSEISALLPKARIIYFGSSALGIDGENDIDIGVIDAEEYIRRGIFLCQKYGGPLKIDEKRHVMRWEFVIKGFTVELFLSDVLEDRRREYIRNHELLEKHVKLRHEYEELKRSCVGLTKRAYMRKKLEFFNAIGMADSSFNTVH